MPNATSGHTLHVVQQQAQIIAHISGQTRDFQYQVDIKDYEIKRLKAARVQLQRSSNELRQKVAQPLAEEEAYEHGVANAHDAFKQQQDEISKLQVIRNLEVYAYAKEERWPYQHPAQMGRRPRFNSFLGISSNSGCKRCSRRERK
jgi:hypothetical protein